MNSNNPNVQTYAVYIVKAVQYLLRMFALDKRSMALWRFLAGIVTIYDLALRYPDIHNHYSDKGVLSRTLILEKFQNQYWISFHLISGADFYISVVFWVHIVVAILMSVGYRTRTMTLLNWLFVCSLQNRNYLVCHSGDTVHRVMLFWSMFLPLGEVFSIDSAFRNKNKTKPRDYSRENMEILGFPAAAFTIQVLVMYVTAHFHKSAPEWREQGVATWMALQLDFFRTPIGSLFSLFPALCRFLTFSVLFWQKWGSIIYFTPVYNQYFKGFSVMGYAAMHVGFGMCLMLELFTWITIAAVLGLTPGWMWDMAIKFFTDSKKPGIQIFYLKHCYKCNNIAHAANILMLPKTKLIPAQSLPPTQDTTPFLGIAVIDSDRTLHTGVNALLAMSKATPLLFPFRFILRNKFVRRALYTLSSLFHYHKPSMVDMEGQSGEQTRGPFGNEPLTNVTEAIPAEDNYSKPYFEEEAVNWQIMKQTWPIAMGVMANLITGFLLYLVIGWNFGNIGMHQYSTPYGLRSVLFVTQLDQYWGMFAPRPPDVMWWYNIEAELHNGRSAEVSQDGALFTFEPNIPHSFDKPYSVHYSMGNHRWFKLFENGLNSHEHREDLRLNFGRWLCREYNARHEGDDRLYKFEIHWMNERVDVQKQDGTRYPLPRQTLWRHMCYER